MSKEKINDLMRELVLLCKAEKMHGRNITVNINNKMEYYASFEFREIGAPLNVILRKKVKDRTEKEHQKIMQGKFYGSVRDYLLSMGDFKDVKI